MPFAKASQVDLKPVTTNQLEWIEKAQAYLKQAEDIGKRIERRKSRHYHDTKLSNAPGFYTKQEIKFTLLAAEAFRVCGEEHWFDSAKAYSRAATLYADALQNSNRAAELFTEAGIVMEKIDTNFAVEYYRKAVSQYCNVTQYKAAALLQERMANNFHEKGHDSAAIEEYQRASKLYGAANMQDSVDRALDKAAYLLGVTGKYRDSAFVYQRLAISHSHQGIKIFNVPSIMLRGSVLLLYDCLLKSTDASEVVDFVRMMYSLDCRFSESREHEFIADIIQCIRRNDLDTFADCVYSFNDVSSEFDQIMLTALNGIKEAIAANRAGAEANKS